MRTNALYSMSTCLAMQGVWQVKHGVCCCSCFSMKECVSLVWPMCKWDVMTCSLFDFLKVGLHSPPKWAGSGRIYHRCYYSRVDAISPEGICWFGLDWIILCMTVNDWY